MRKALIFVSAFVVSSMIIYMFYYYSQQHKLTRGIVATAAELPKTHISPIKPKHFSDTSYMGSLGLLLAFDTVENKYFSTPPKNTTVLLNRAFDVALINDVNEDISSKFPNHPPIGFTHIKDGEKILFSYYFQNFILPEGFRLSSQSIDNEWYRSLRYTSDGTNKVKAFSGDSIYGIVIDGHNYKLIISSRPLNDTFKIDAQNLPKDKIAEFPEIDFNIIKYWKPEEAAKFLPSVPGHKHIEQRMKFKLSLQKNNDGDILQKQKAADYNFTKPFYLYLFSEAEAKPYLMLYVNNNELLLPLQPKSR